VTLRHFLEVDDLSIEELIRVLDLSEVPWEPVLSGKGAALIFEKPSLRTRNASEMAVFQLGGHPAYISNQEISLGTRESTEDIVRTLQGYYGLIAARVFDHGHLERMVSVARVPVINLLSDAGHPVQALADLLTIRQHVGAFGDVSIGWVGDFSNVARSLAIGAAMLGAKFAVASPPGYGPTPADVDRLAALSVGPQIQVFSRPEDALNGANVVTTDAWYSMGQEGEKEIRRRAFEGFRVDPAMMRFARPDAIFLHCLPAHREEEVTSEVLDGPQSRIWPQAHNRLHTFRGLLLWLAEQGAFA
jgi:ornithine carbamoyltransferase